MTPNVIEPSIKGLPMRNSEEAIRERAYQLWIADGQPEGKAEFYWLSAQGEVLTRSPEESDDPATGHMDAVSAATMTAEKVRVTRSRKSKSRAA
jgi:hypothetical protein